MTKPPYKTIQMRVLRPVGRKIKGQILTLEVDQDGLIVDRFWRSRLVDSKKDGCVEIVDPAAKTSAKKAEV